MRPMPAPSALTGLDGSHERGDQLFFAAHHAGQNRKDGSPFVTHPLAVAQIVAE